MAKVTTCSTLGWAHYTLYQALPRIARMGFRDVEIASFDAYCFHFNFGSPTPAELRQMLSDHGMTACVFHYSRGLHDATRTSEIDRFVDDWTRKMEHIAELGIPMMSMVFGERNDQADQENMLANAVKAYDKVASIASGYGIKMLLEVPHVYTIMPRPEQVYWLFDRFESENIGALVDCSHWGIIGYDIDEFFGRLKDRLWHIHLRDSRGTDTADRKQELEFTPGDGIVDFRKFGEALDRVGYRGSVSLEFEYRDITLEATDREFEKGIRHLVSCGWEMPEGVIS